MTRNVTLFVEDAGHEAFTVAWIHRLARVYSIKVAIRPYSVRGGHGRALSELSDFITQVRGAEEGWADLIVVAIDTNCSKYATQRGKFERVVSGLTVPLVLAIPEPHVERWLLLDSAAFKAVLGKGCRAPDKKCDRDRYKELLAQAVSDAGLAPTIGGIEHARDIVDAMDLSRLSRKGADKSLSRFLKDLDSVFRRWSTT